MCLVWRPFLAFEFLIFELEVVGVVRRRRVRQGRQPPIIVFARAQKLPMQEVIVRLRVQAWANLVAPSLQFCADQTSDAEVRLEERREKR